AAGVSVAKAGVCRSVEGAAACEKTETREGGTTIDGFVIGRLNPFGEVARCGRWVARWAIVARVARPATVTTRGEAHAHDGSVRPRIAAPATMPRSERRRANTEAMHTLSLQIALIAAL